jgi:IclR family acetate operon transcriptional repressor
VSRVQAVERAFAVLAALADGPIGVTEVAERVHLPKSTVARLLRSLQHEGAVEQVPGETRYRVGERMALLAARLTPGASLVSLARPTLEELAAEVGEAAGLGVPDGFRVHYIDQADTSNAVQARDWTGTRVPMHAVPSGQALLAYLPAPEFARFLGKPLERFTPNTITDAGELLARLDRIRADGVAWVHEEFDVGINSAAAVVLGEGGRPVAAIHVHGPSYRFPAAGDEARISRLLRVAAGRISASLNRAA